ncbi:HNH endonuclease [Mycobacterium avium]|uniref:HNH endonuclease n=1 Tax=Mycobacterium avium TaxID=1764 RepID=UPI001CDB200E|nr:HNH endonuclease signature motif containing protein [Mycobacterium avium]MCA2331619.1 HNH endonuclease [Mycobacterium avium]
MWASTSRRHAELPANWPAIHDQVLREARWLCEIGWSGCLVEATEVDHKKRGNDHSRSNLQAACSWCHGQKSSAEGVAQRRKLKAQRSRPTERHPGRR